MAFIQNLVPVILTRMDLPFTAQYPQQIVTIQRFGQDAVHAGLSIDTIIAFQHMGRQRHNPSVL